MTWLHSHFMTWCNDTSEAGPHVCIICAQSWRFLVWKAPMGAARVRCLNSKSQFTLKRISMIRTSFSRSPFFFGLPDLVFLWGSYPEAGLPPSFSELLSWSRSNKQEEIEGLNGWNSEGVLKGFHWCQRGPYRFHVSHARAKTVTQAGFCWPFPWSRLIWNCRSPSPITDPVLCASWESQGRIQSAAFLLDEGTPEQRSKLWWNSIILTGS